MEVKRKILTTVAAELRNRSSNHEKSAKKSLETEPVTNNNNKFFCRFCKKVFYLTRFLDEHERTHTHPFKCKKCNESWVYFSGLNDHIKKGCAPPPEPPPPPSRLIINPAMFDPFYIPDDEPYVPPDDFSDEEVPGPGTNNKKSPVGAGKEKGSNKTQQQNGIGKKKIDLSKFKCRTCGKGWKNLACLVKHERTHARPHQCTHCSDRFSEFYQLRAHMLKYHKETIPTKTDIKTEATSTIIDTNTAAETNDVKPLVSDITSNKTTAGKDTKKLVVTSGKTVTCELCFKLISSNSLRVHMRSHSGIKPYACPQCPYRSTQSGPLTYHMKHHNEVNEFKCNHCTASYKDTNTLQRHVKLHQESLSSVPAPANTTIKTENETQLSPYDFTPSPTSSSQSKSPSKSKSPKKKSPSKSKPLVALALQEQMQQSNTNNPLPKETKCKFCNKSFKSFIRLNTHELFHNSNYTCTICEVGFGKNADLTRHYKSKVHQGRVQNQHPQNNSTSNHSFGFNIMDSESGEPMSISGDGDVELMKALENGVGDSNGFLDFDLNDYV